MKNDHEMLCPWGHGRPWAGPEDFLNFYRSLRSAGLTEEEAYIIILKRLSNTVWQMYDENYKFRGVRIPTICGFNKENMRCALQTACEARKLKKSIVEIVIIP